MYFFITDPLIYKTKIKDQNERQKLPIGLATLSGVGGLGEFLPFW
jgi:hypothetical protein